MIDKNFDLTNQSGAPQVNRVKNLCAPAGTDDVRFPIYQFVYDLSTLKDGWNRIVTHGCCDVYNVFGYRTQYGFNKDQRLTCINKFIANGLPYTQERLFWAENGSKDTSCLITRDLLSASGTIFARNYQYDLAGNVLVDSLYGNLTGHNLSSPIVLPNGEVIENGCDCLRKYQEYSQDGLNLLVREFDGILTTMYYYEPGSNRLIGKLQGSPEKWERRNYYFYNEDAALIQEISDDGYQMDFRDLAGVTERKIINYTPSKTYPFAYPLVIEEKCLNLENGQEELIHKVVNSYNKCIITACNGFFLSDEDGVHKEIKIFAKEVATTDNLRLVGFGDSTIKGLVFSLTFFSSQIPTLDEARSIFYDISTKFLNQINSNEKLRSQTENNLFTIENITLRIIFAKSPGYISMVSNGSVFDRNPLQYVYFYTYINENEKFGYGSNEPYEQVKSIVESQRGLNYSQNCGL